MVDYGQDAECIEGSFEIFQNVETKERRVIVNMVLQDHEIQWLVIPTEDHYVIQLKDTTWVEITDIIEAKVELSSLIRENFDDITEHSIGLFKEMLESAWVAPRIAQVQMETVQWD